MRESATSELRPRRPWPGGGARRGSSAGWCTNNPFYVLSAGLFLAACGASFGGQHQDVNTLGADVRPGGLHPPPGRDRVPPGRSPASGMTCEPCSAGVLLFLATSVTSTRLLVFNPDRGVTCYLGGLAVPIAVSEALLPGIRLACPLWFRAP